MAGAGACEGAGDGVCQGVTAPMPPMLAARDWSAPGLACGSSSGISSSNKSSSFAVAGRSAIDGGAEFGLTAKRHLEVYPDGASSWPASGWF